MIEGALNLGTEFGRQIHLLGLGCSTDYIVTLDTWITLLPAGTLGLLLAMVNRIVFVKFETRGVSLSLAWVWMTFGLGLRNCSVSKEPRLGQAGTDMDWGAHHQEGEMIMR